MDLAYHMTSEGRNSDTRELPRVLVHSVLVSPWHTKDISW